LLVYTNILVPLDTGPESDAALPHARAVAEAFGSRVTLLLVAEAANVTVAALAESFGAGGSVAAAIERENTLEAVGMAYLSNVRESEGLDDWDLLVVEGSPGAAIVEVLRDGTFDLVVMASHARRGLGLLLHGSVADHVVRHGRVPTLVIAADED
jgi:nucleotide-binding universal stress UspA family protein